MLSSGFLEKLITIIKIKTKIKLFFKILYIFFLSTKKIRNKFKIKMVKFKVSLSEKKKFKINPSMESEIRDINVVSFNVI